MESNKIIYKAPSRSEVLSDQKLSTLDYVYSISYPTPEKSFIDMCKDLNEEREKEGGDNNWRKTYCDKKYQWPFDFFYIPQKALEEVWKGYENAFRLQDHWKENCEFLLSLFKDGKGLKEVYSPTEYSNGKPVRHCEETAPLNEIIDKESAEKVIDLVESYMKTYKFYSLDVNSFAWAFLSTPSSNRDKVKAAWKEAFGIDIDIPEDSQWISAYDVDWSEDDE